MMRQSKHTWPSQLSLAVIVLVIPAVTLCLFIERSQSHSIAPLPELARIEDPKISDAELKSAVKKISDSPPSEGMAFWRDIVQSDSYSNRHRAICLFMLVSRYCARTSSLGSVGRLDLDARWTNPKDIWDVTDGAWLPEAVDRDHAGTVFAWQPPFCQSIHAAIYISLEGKAEGDDVVSQLNGRGFWNGHAIHRVVLDCPDWP